MLILQCKTLPFPLFLVLCSESGKSGSPSCNFYHWISTKPVLARNMGQYGARGKLVRIVVGPTSLEHGLGVCYAI